GVAFAFADRLWLLVVVALTGALSTEVVESGPFTSLEQSMLATEEGPRRMHVYSRYNAIATAAGAVGALASGLPGLLQRLGRAAPHGSLRAVAHDGVHALAVERVAHVHPAGTKTCRRGRAVVRAHSFVTDRRSYPPGVRDGTRHRRGAHPGGGLHEHGPVSHP